MAKRRGLGNSEEWTLKVEPRIVCLWRRIETCVKGAGFSRSDVLRWALLWFGGLTGAVVIRHGEWERLKLLAKVLRRCMEEVEGVCALDGGFVSAGRRKTRPRL